jgi:UDP-glucose 4-epimerase
VFPRRPGDIMSLYAHTQKVEQSLCWKARHDFSYMVSTAYAWQQKLKTTNTSCP